MSTQTITGSTLAAILGSDVDRDADAEFSLTVEGVRDYRAEMTYAAATTRDKTQRKRLDLVAHLTESPNVIFVVSRRYFDDPDREWQVVYSGTDLGTAVDKYNGLD